MKHLLMPYMLRNCLIFLFFILSFSVNAIEVENLYSAKVVVSSQSAADRVRALKNALEGVITKVGGKKIEHPLVSQAIKNYNGYVNQYQYIRSNETTYLNVSFNETKINNLFKQSDLAIWGRLRPQVMVWVIEENGLERNLLSATSTSTIPSAIDDFSQLRGLPLVMPIMDLTDLSALTTTDVWGRFAQPVAQASARYLAEAIVVIRISNNSLVVEQEELDCQPLCQAQPKVLDWSLMADAQDEYSQIFSQQYQGDDVLVMLNTALSEITDVIYQQYALSTSNSNEFLIDVANIDNLVDLIAVSDFLAELSAVESVQLVSAQGSNRRFKLSLIGSQQALLASLKLSEELNQYIDPLAGPAQKNEVAVFFWGQK